LHVPVLENAVVFHLHGSTVQHFLVAVVASARQVREREAVGGNVVARDSRYDLTLPQAPQPGRSGAFDEAYDLALAAHSKVVRGMCCMPRCWVHMMTLPRCWVCS
jgi:hypothetical protein